MQSRRPDGGVKVFDDFREAYSWLSHNTGGWHEADAYGCYDLAVDQCFMKGVCVPSIQKYRCMHSW